MQVIAWKSVDLFLMFLLFFFVSVVFVVAGLIIGFPSGLIMLIPLIITCPTTAFFLHSHIKTPNDLIILNEETKEITVKRSKNKSITFPLSDVESISSYSSSSRESRTSTISFHFNDGAIVVRYVADPDGVINALFKLKQ